MENITENNSETLRDEYPKIITKQQVNNHAEKILDLHKDYRDVCEQFEGLDNYRIDLERMIIDKSLENEHLEEILKSYKNWNAKELEKLHVYLVNKAETVEGLIEYHQHKDKQVEALRVTAKYLQYELDGARSYIKRLEEEIAELKEEPYVGEVAGTVTIKEYYF